MPKPKPFDVGPQKRRMSAEAREREALESQARATEPDDLEWFFRGITRDGRWHLSRLAMTRRGRLLIIRFLKDRYCAEDKELRAIVSRIVRRSRSRRP